jgi:ribonuclease HI
MNFSLFSDGGSRGNPGPAGAGFALFDEKNTEIFAGKKFLGIATNNVAEYNALILGIEKAIEMGGKNLSCFLDSELIVKQLNGEYRVKHPDMKPLFAQVQTLKNHFQSVSFTHVRREKNKRADELANHAMDSKK